MARNLVIDLQDAHASMTYLIRDRDSKYTAAFDAVVADSGITTITTGIRIPRMNAIMERWIRTCRTELLDRTLILNQPHLLHAYANSKRSTTTTEPTAPCMPQLPFTHSPNRSPKQSNSTSSPSDGEIDSAASFMNTTMPPNSTDEDFGTYSPACACSGDLAVANDPSPPPRRCSRYAVCPDKPSRTPVWASPRW